jgi:hypothetical protein
MYLSLYFKYTFTNKVLVFLYSYVITRTNKIRHVLKWRRDTFLCMSCRGDLMTCAALSKLATMGGSWILLFLCAQHQAVPPFLMVCSIRGRLFFFVKLKNWRPWCGFLCKKMGLSAGNNPLLWVHVVTRLKYFFSKWSLPFSDDMKSVVIKIVPLLIRLICLINFAAHCWTYRINFNDSGWVESQWGMDGSQLEH